MFVAIAQMAYAQSSYKFLKSIPIGGDGIAPSLPFTMIIENE